MTKEDLSKLLDAGWIPLSENTPPPVTPVLVLGWCCDICHNVSIAEWEDGVGWWQSNTGDGLLFKPEYWMSLPFPFTASDDSSAKWTKSFTNL
jgi:hypothetical protein